MSYFFRREQLIKAAKGKGNPWKNAGGKFSSEGEDEDSQPYHYTGKRGGKEAKVYRGKDGKSYNLVVYPKEDAQWVVQEAGKGRGTMDEVAEYRSKDEAKYAIRTGDWNLKDYRNAPKVLKGRLGDDVSPTKRTAMIGYMEGFWKNIKDDVERVYCAARSKQVCMGEPRPDGMGSEMGLTPDRVRALEIVIAKVFKAGRIKHGV